MQSRKRQKFSRAQERELLEHLRTHLNPDYAKFLVQEFDILCSSIKPAKKGRRKLHFIDGMISVLNPNAFKRGRKKQDQRADLIRWLSDYYPDPNHWPRQSRGGDFETTVKKVLKFSGLRCPADAVDMVHDALRDHEHPNLRSKAIQTIWEDIQRHSEI